MGLRLTVHHTEPLPIYAQIVQQVRYAILAGDMRPGEKIPTVRQLAVDLAVNSNTIARAYAELHREGLIDMRQGVGTFVSPHPRPPAERSRKTRLAALAHSAVIEAAAIGASVDDLLEAIREQRTE